MPRILLVEDDEDIREMLAMSLRAQSFDTDECGDGETALAMMRSNQYDLLILDWGLPGLSGLELCKRYRSNQGEAPVLFLTARDKIDSKLEGFSAGADDYLTKPFQTAELIARAQALTRRHKAITEDVLRHLDLELDAKARTLKRGGVEISLSPREFDLLHFLMRRPHEVFSAQHLSDRLSDSTSTTTDQYARTIIMRLREAIDVEGQPSYIANVKHHGYGLRQR